MTLYGAIDSRRRPSALRLHVMRSGKPSRDPRSELVTRQKLQSPRSIIARIAMPSLATMPKTFAPVAPCVTLLLMKHAGPVMASWRDGTL